MMKLVADFHIHSHYSRATSRDLTIPHLAIWAQRKGVHIVGTGDITHPGWTAELKETLEPAEEGLFRLKEDVAKAVAEGVPPACQGTVRFILTGEISNIYKKNGRVRKIHNVVFVPSFEAAEKLQAALEKISNIRADGRPILGLDSRDLLEIVLEIDPDCHLVPAHIWTPWFSLLGSRSGFDAVEECFDDLTPHIFALETGLSSDPPMNWRVSALDRYTLISCSDAHSPQKLAREATLFDTELAYTAIFDALKTGDLKACLGTIEFFPEEGKYHYDGHRKCGISWDPKTTLAHGGLCPVCGKPVTVGVMHRVETLADRPEGARKPNAHPFHSLIPLTEILGELLGVGSGSKRVRREYERLLAHLGPELAILMDVPLEAIATVGGDRLAAGIGRMRQGQVTAIPGYDGEYGIIKLFDEVEDRAPSMQMGLFGDALPGPAAGVQEQPAAYAPELTSQSTEPGTSVTPAEQDTAHVQPAPLPPFDPDVVSPSPVHPPSAPPSPLDALNPQQREAVQCIDAPLIIVAGPGTGKTRTLTVRIAYLIQERGVDPESVLAITFTNKAAGEMAERLAGLLGQDVASRITIKTFHAFGAMLLRQWGERAGIPSDFTIIGDEERRWILRRALPDLDRRRVDVYLGLIAAAKNRLLTPESPDLADALSDVLLPERGGEAMEAAALKAAYRAYEEALRRVQAIDFDDLVVKTVHLLEDHPDVLQTLHAHYRWISVDEYQDVNHAQYRLLRLLTAGGANLCVIGDPDQAIYGFRGADRRYFLSFQRDYPDARVVRLTQNYRSVQAILDAATQVISKSPDRDAMQLWSQFVEEVKLEVYQAPTEKAEAEYVVHQIERMMGGTSYFSLDSGRVEDDHPSARSFGDFVVLYRLRAQVAPLLEAFDRSGIPYQTIGQVPFYARPVVREALACLWLLHNPRSRLHLEVILSSGKERFSAEALDRVLAVISAHPDALAEALAHAADLTGLTAAQRRRLAALASLWENMSLGDHDSTPDGLSVAQLVERVHYFLAAQRDLTEDEEEHLRQLASRAAAFDDRLAAFLEAVTLQSETDAYDPRADRVALMTLHAAKGLEFPVVFIVGCEEGLLPYLPEDGRADLDEERRLFYVGMTRAQRKLILTHARTRFLFGRRMEQSPSRFLNDIEAALKEVREAEARRRQRKPPPAEQLRLF
ncbi:MAG TPA: UvrD-helicase domain-containing protein [Caldilineae bacterium]|nr:UvrD-helicase domain-containing protein [Caldilineae bacterium]